MYPCDEHPSCSIFFQILITSHSVDFLTHPWVSFININDALVPSVVLATPVSFSQALPQTCDPEIAFY